MLHSDQTGSDEATNKTDNYLDPFSYANEVELKLMTDKDKASLTNNYNKQIHNNLINITTTYVHKIQ